MLMFSLKIKHMTEKKALALLASFHIVKSLCGDCVCFDGLALSTNSLAAHSYAGLDEAEPKVCHFATF